VRYGECELLTSNLLQLWGIGSGLGNKEAWDNHGEAFWRLREKLFPPTDRALSALFDDLVSSGLPDSTLLVMGDEFGRTPKISLVAEYYQAPGRDH
jgi:hypothetical protein